MLRPRRWSAREWRRRLGRFGPIALLMWLGRLWSWALVAVVIGLVVGLVPLAGVLGFELAVIGSAFGAVMGLDVGAAVARELAVMPAPGLSRAMGAGRMLLRTTIAASGVAI